MPGTVKFGDPKMYFICAVNKLVATSPVDLLIILLMLHKCCCIYNTIFLFLIGVLELRVKCRELHSGVCLSPVPVARLNVTE